MNKPLLLAASLLAVLALDARTLTPEEALARVSRSDVPLRARTLSSDMGRMKLARTAATSAGDPAVYLFDNVGKGYMLVSADDVAEPLLGYSESGDVAASEIPPQMEWWLSEYAREIEAAQAAEYSGNVRLDLTGASPRAARPVRRPVEPLVKATWSQDAPYNNLCPLQGSRRTVAGCVATAMAQIMTYFSYPPHGTGTGTATVNGGSSQTMNLGVDFDWDNMLDNYRGTYTAAQATAAATLTKACGFATEMDYTSSASGTQSYKVVPALVNNFSYDPSARYYYRTYYGLMEWEEMIYDNLANVGPVYYNGAAPEGGHAFVCDGYSSDGYFHFNWGWNGMYNGYFLLTALAPEGQGIGGYAGGYNSDQGVILSIRKPTGTPAPAREPRLSMELSDGPLEASMSGTTLTLTLNQGSSNGWWNFTGAAFSAQLGILFTNASNPSDVKSVLLGNTGNVAERTGYRQLPVNVASAGLATGVAYRVEVATRANAYSQWLPALCPIGRMGYALVTRSASGTYTATVPSDVTFAWESGTLDSPVYYQMPAKMTVTLLNDSETEMMRMIAPVLVAQSGSQTVLKALADGELFDLESGQSETREITFTFDKFYNNMQLGSKVYVGLIDMETSLLLGRFDEQITFNSAPAAGTLTERSFSISGGAIVKDASDIWFDATVRLSSGYLASPVLVAVTDSSYGTNVLALGTSETLFMEGGKDYRTRIHVDMSTAAPGTYYATLCRQTSSGYMPLSASVVSFTIGSDSAVDEVNADTEAGLPVEYYNLQGIRVLHPEKGGVYIRRQGSSVDKVRF